MARKRKTAGAAATKARRATKKRPIKQQKAKTPSVPKPSGKKQPKSSATAATHPAKKSRARHADVDARVRPDPNEVIVRMYRQGLGDCFLLSFGTADPDKPCHILIDCGVHKRQDKGPARLAHVMKDLLAATGGRFDVVVATHEHADHLSGFVQKDSPFLTDGIEIGALWLAWTEKFGDTEADKLRRKRGVARRVLNQAVKRARQMGQRAGGALGLDGLARRVEDILRFEEPPGPGFDAATESAVRKAIVSHAEAQGKPAWVADLLAGAAGGNGTGGNGQALGVAAGKKKTKPSSNELALGLLKLMGKPRYCDPGDVVPVPRVPSVRAYSLGPPRGDLLNQDQPTKVRGKDGEYKEIYLSGAANTTAFELSPEVNSQDSGEAIPRDHRFPFALPFRHSLGRKARTGDAGMENAWTTSARSHANGYSSPKNAWRRIDGDWLGGAEQLALNLDSDTNNTSLVLAFEIGPPGKGRVLLFPGDAQVGNWLSWRDQEYRVGRQSFTADDILRRTVLYKVGHHASHNATVKQDPRDTSASASGAPFGLELMQDIIAMIPVDHAAVEKKMPVPWEMPAKKLYKRLREKASLRVLRADDSIRPLTSHDDADVVPQRTTWTDVPGMPGLQWRKASSKFADTETALYYDVRIPIAATDG